LSYLFTNKKVILPSNDLNRTEENLRLCGALARGPAQEALEAMIYVAPDVQDEVNAFYEELFDGGKLVAAIHVPVDRPEKQWPPEYYATLADRLLADGRFEVLLTWGPGQFDIVEKVRALTKRNPVIAPATPDLKHYTWLVHRADLYVGGDTGPMHIAAAMGTPVVALFGGTNPNKHAPFRKPCKVLHDDSPSLSPEEKMRRITPEMVYDACVQLVAKH
jgi:ADP-heptose:LPS heptosyltransferase